MTTAISRTPRSHRLSVRPVGRVRHGRAVQMRNRRRGIADRYIAAFAGLAVLETPVVPDGRVSAWHLFVLRLDKGSQEGQRDHCIELLKAAGLGTSMHFIQLHLLGYYRETYGYKREDLSVALDLYERSRSLPIYRRMSDEEVERVIEAVRAMTRVLNP